MATEDEPESDDFETWRLEPALRWGVPIAALDLYGRWWQLETWLRQLVYVELRAERGIEWHTAVPQIEQAAKRTARDAAAPYMGTADVDNPLAYLDFSQLIGLISAHWELFGVSLIEHSAWEGRIGELLRIRHRIGHLRRPHSDDVGRLVQLLRDLQRGTFIALASYNRQWVPEADNTDAVSAGWLLRHHHDARRLMDHAERRYDTQLILRRSRRPWVDREQSGAGDLWHATFLLGSRSVRAIELWRDTRLDRNVRPLLLHMLMDGPGSVSFTFPAVDDAARVADAIGNAFDAVLTASRYDRSYEVERSAWAVGAEELDHRVLVRTGWNIVDESTVPIDLFGVGSGVRAVPTWG